MAKIDDVIDQVSAVYQNVQIQSGTAWVEDAHMEQYGVRRKATGQTHHKLWYFSIAEQGQQATVFWGHRFTDALKKVMKWRGMETKTKRGPRKPAQQTA